MAASSSLDVLHSVIDMGVVSHIPQSSVWHYEVNERKKKETVTQEKHCLDSKHLKSVQDKKTIATRSLHSANDSKKKTSPHITLGRRRVKPRKE